MNEREYDVVLYGASGFTGRQTVAYFAAHAPAGLRWAIAGRDRRRLERVRQQFGPLVGAVDVLVADSSDQPAVDDIVRRTRVLLTTAGPFARFGTPLVDACVRFNTHYVDITGESSWVRQLVAQYHDHAAATGTRLVPGCGFDSVPSDLGAMLVARYAQQALGSPCVAVRGYFRMRGGLNGGTAATAVHNAATQVRARRDPIRPDDPAPPRRRAAALPHRDGAIGAWVGPFVMADINTRVVRRSARLFEQWKESYGPRFEYQEFAGFTGPLAAAKAWRATATLGALGLLLRWPAGRTLAAKLAPSPGEGPTEAAMDAGWFRAEFVGFTEDGQTVNGLVAGQGDPGNRSTVRMVCESALALALNEADLPGFPARGGILTPATALGDVLVRRLRSAGITIRVPDTSPGR
jgi:short subunit dehydrogenase-like uncharacterized protein